MTAPTNKVQPTVYIIGAGLAGTMIAHEIKRKGVFGRVAAFLDDDPQKIGTKIEDIPVLGPIQDVASLIRVEARDEVLIAIPSIKAERLREIYAIVKEAGFTTIKLLPGISQIVDDSAHLVQAREINPQDLLGRTPIKISLKSSLAYLRGKRVLITGAGGSIGSELARQLLSGGAERLYLFGHGENSIYQIDKELRLLQEEGVGDKATIVPIVGELKDRDYMRYIIGKLRCDAVFHTAAYKHVPLMEANPVAVIENNVFGTKNLLDACIENGVKRFVLISTDKAVNPVSIYGVSKMLNEKMVLDAAARISEKYGSPDYAYMFVRFGNVLGSRGSIFPLFVEQVKKGGPVTVTSPDMMRFFMTIPEACSLVLQTGGVGINGQSYLLDMGEPVNILETARQLIRYMGYEPEKDIPIEIIGVRPGERLEEPLTSKTEYTEQTDYPKILRLQNREEYSSGTLRTLLAALQPVCCSSDNPALYRNKEYLTRILCDACTSFREAQS
ncbi:polysaccharide biosynthesis protein [Treponema vincentii]|uniref:polysaccharide biosynthesis protein n=1 Tax=Treponema vincentii TaxID=69710 RepID=UPI0020A43348|nr:nucleoside-diphosphate sugar epimerase/dehydratase [Treponema vincentii]UTC46647.1 polysaccharide biosynthesis protein [Treponema vincentii]